MYPSLALAIETASLVVAAWCAVPAVRGRWLDLTHLAVLALLELGLLIQAVVAVVRMAGGDRPEELATFIGYLITSVLLIPAAVALSLMERTRSGAVIAGAGAVVVAVVTLRLSQVWG